MYQQILETTKFIKSQTELAPRVGIILGTGLGNLTEVIETDVSLPYESIPNFPQSTVEGHGGKLILGKLSGVPVVALQGRFHYYEGYNMQEVVFPVRVMKLLGIETLVVSNASGGVNPDFEVGDLMIINDHIDLFPESPLRGKNIDELGPRFPDMSEPYSNDLIKKAREIAGENKISVREGVYAGMRGPTYETPAEYNYVRIIGADAVGMSTVPEVIVARHMDLKCFGMSVITDLGVPGKIVEITHEEVQEVSRNAEPKMTKIVSELIKGNGSIN